MSVGRVRCHTGSGNRIFDRLKSEGVFQTQNPISEKTVLRLLDEPAQVNGRPHRYRFPNQRARRISKAMQELTQIELATDKPVTFRNQIQSLEGVGPKTASWIARNWLDTDEIAILDIHVLRAGWIIRLFEKDCRLPTQYEELERRFLFFSNELQVRASVLDAVMWSDMRNFGSRLARNLSMN